MLYLFHMKYELIIIGGGPAGTAAAVYAARKQLKTLMITREFGGQSQVSEKIYNWIGTPEISGADLAKSFEKHARSYEGEFLTIHNGDGVVSVTKEAERLFTVTTEKGQVFSTETILVTTGSSRKKLKIPGADTYDNKGIVYCASCDGPLFSGQDVVVIGGGNAGFESAAQLLAYTNSVTLLHRNNEYRADPVTVEKVLAHPKMTGLLNADITGVQGDMFVKSITYVDKTTGTEHTLPVGGVFVEIGQIPNTEYVASLVERDEFGRIKINPRTQATTQPGIWAAGDCSDILYHQNNIAAGDGVRALEDIYLFVRAS